MVVGADIGLFALPRFQLLADLWRSGQLPGWNPWFGCGSPLYGDLSFAVLYPANALVLVLEPMEALSVYLLGHMAVGYFGTYALLRDRRCGRHAAALAALAFGAGGLALGHVSTPIYVAATGWLPWCVLGFVRWSRAPGSSARLALAVLPFALTFLAGAPENCLTAAAVALMIARPATGHSWPRLAARMLLLGALTALCCAALLVPALLVIAESTRAAGLAANEASRWSLSPVQLVQLLSPLRVGYQGLPIEVLLSDYRPWHGSLYAGVVPFAGLLLGLGPAWRERRGVLLGMGGLLLLALGRYTPLYPLLSELVPGLRAFRYPAKLFVPTWFLACVVAGPGLQRALDSPEARRALGWILLALATINVILSGLAAAWSTHAAALAAPATGVALAAYFSLRARRPMRWLLALTLLDLALAGNAQLETAPRGLLDAPMLAYAVQREQQRQGLPQRVGTLSSALSVGLDLSAHGAGRLSSQQSSLRQALLPNAGAPFGVRTVTSFSSILLARHQLLRAAGNDQDVPEFKLNALLGAQLLVSTLGDAAAVASHVTPVADAGLWQLGRLRQTLPWVGLYRAPRVARTAVDACAQRLEAPWNETVLEAPFDALSWIPPGAHEPTEVDTRGVRLLRLEHDRVELRTNAPGRRVLVLREAYASGWEAYVDGESTQIYPADVLYRAVEVPPGAHAVSFRYRVRGLDLGVLLSALGGLALLAIPWLLRSKR